MNNTFQKSILGLVLILTSGCAVLHHVQMSDVDARSNYVAVPVEVKVSETGVDMGDVKGISEAITRGNNGGGSGRNAVGDIAAIIEMFQIGPRTGAPVYTDKYAEKIIYQLHTQCPSGKLTGIQSIRETRKYPVISGEIVKITGFCLREKGT